jgi:hypothetical protein
MPMREGKPPYGDYDAGAHAKQPHGKSIGCNDEHRAEDTKHWGERGSEATPEHRKPPAGIPANNEGSELVYNDGMGHAKQPSGKSIDAGTTDIAEHHKPSRMGEAHSFRQPEMKEAHTFSGTRKSGHHRLSGHSGAHMIGKR